VYNLVQSQAYMERTWERAWERVWERLESVLESVLLTQNANARSWKGPIRLLPPIRKQ
jgi:hypothetical protein